MKVTLVFNPKMTDEQIEHSHLLALALLNFDHQVSLLFVGQSFANLLSKPELKKRILSLKMFGADALYQLGQIEPLALFNEALENLDLIDDVVLDDLKNHMDLLL